MSNHYIYTITTSFHTKDTHEVRNQRQDNLLVLRCNKCSVSSTHYASKLRIISCIPGGPFPHPSLSIHTLLWLQTLVYPIRDAYASYHVKDNNSGASNVEQSRELTIWTQRCLHNVAKILASFNIAQNGRVDSLDVLRSLEMGWEPLNSCPSSYIF